MNMMKRTKGITIWEQYIEMGVLGIVCILFVFFVATQFIGQANVVNVPNHGDVGPTEVDGLLEDEARRINARLQPDAAPPVTLDPPQAIAERFLARLDGRTSPPSPQTFAFASVPLGVGERIPPEAIFAVPEIPTPQSVVTRQYFDALTEEAVETHEALQDRYDEPPYDVTWNTVAGTFDISEVLAQFRKGEHNGDPAPIPQSWHNDRATVVNVIVEREELVDGEWVNRTELSPIPGQFHLHEELSDAIDSARRDMILRMVRTPERQRALVQPPFLSTRNELWQPPDPMLDETEEVVDEEQRVRRLQQQIARGRAELEELKRALEELPSSGGQGPPRGGGGDRSPPGGGRSPGGGGPGGGPGGPSGPSGPPRGPDGSGTPRDPGRIDAMRQNLEQSIARVERRIERAEQELRELRPDFDVESVEADPFELGEVTIWAHDMDIVHGYNYRYRMAVELYNPFFGRLLHLVPEQEHLAENFSIRSSFSAWSDAISVRPPVHVFVTRAYPPGHDRLGGIMGRTLGEATIEVFRYYDGRWWEQRFSLEPGQRVGDRRESGARGEDGPMIDFGTDWFVLDIIPDLDATTRQSVDGRGAMVILQHLRYGEMMEIRHPLSDTESDLRQRLRAEIQVALRE